MRREEGMTIVEVMVAGMILVLGALGVLGVVDAATRNTFRAEQSQVVSNVLQQEMEKLRQIPYAELALNESPPDHSDDADHPNNRISNDTFFYTGRNKTGLKPLVYEGAQNGTETITGGTVDPGPTPFEVGDVRGDVYRYVVWDTCPSALCFDGRHLKRAIVVVSLDETASGGVRRYQEVQSQFVNPDAEPSTFPGQDPGHDGDIAWTLYLTDTPCDQPDRLPGLEAAGGHATHNTRGDCDDGPQAGKNVPGAPDLLATSQPEDSEDAKYDYATDVNPQPDDDEGLQLMTGGDCSSAEMTGLASGVGVEPDADPTTFQKVHRWLSAPMPEGGDVLLAGEGTLSLWTRTISGAVYPGRICAWLFVRSYGETTITDTMAVNLGPPLSLHFEHFAQSWSSGFEDEVTVPLSFGYAEEGGALPLPPGSRLGLALSVDDDTPSGLQFLYDRASFESKLVLDTTGARPPGT